MLIDTRNQTFLHECIHLISYALSLDLKEEQIDGVANGFYGLLKENPKLMEWMFEKR